MTHRFTKGAMDYAPGVLWLVRNRIAQFEAQHKQKPECMVLHEHTVSRLSDEQAARDGLIGVARMVPASLLVGGQFDGIPFYVCHCKKPFAEDLLFLRRGVEPEEL